LGHSVLCVVPGTQREAVRMDSTFSNWRSAAIGLGLTVAVVGAGLAFAFW
jgi:hypothetical protein